MRLLTVGDSFTYGEELDDKAKSWPSLLAAKLGHNLINLSKPGSGNTRMVRHAVDLVNDYDLVIIGWSHFARIELADERSYYDLWPGCDGKPHKYNAPWRKEVIDYISRYHDDDYLYRQYLINIILLQRFLESNDKRYLMLDSFGNHQANQRTHNDNRALLAQINDKFYIGWPNESMMEWTFGTPQGPCNHFLEEGHDIVTNKIYTHMEKLNWLS
jgi:hypothetical protein